MQIILKQLEKCMKRSKIALEKIGFSTSLKNLKKNKH